ncbi:glycoside hydrolase family 79 protein [Hymenopellis radicata]|nr:glycoside hydrolase family 79 protein [Hymenopellis radicata]
MASTLSNLTLPGPPALPFNASHHIHPALHSFSIETAFWTAYMGNVTHPSILTKNLLANLKDRTGTPVQVRIGGITADSTFWDDNLDTPLFNFVTEGGDLVNTTIGPDFWKTFAVLPDDTEIVMNLNLDTGIYEAALLVANATVQGLQPGQLIAMEIGNEPDHYGKYTAQTYAETWKTWSKNISDALDITEPFFQIAATAEDPIWPYGTAAGDAALDCVSALKAGANNESTTKWCSEHTYQYSVCDPTRAAVATLTNLVNHTRLAMINYVRENLGDDAFVVGEYNSVSCAGHDGVSNTFGQALWLLDTTLYAASINISRMYIHQGGPLSAQGDLQLNHGGMSLYNLWYPVSNKNGPVKIFPSYYAYLFIAETLGPSTTLRIGNVWPGRQANNSGITTELGDTSAGQLVAYGFWDDAVSTEYPTKLALLNLESYNETTAVRPNSTFDISTYVACDQSIRVRRLQAPGANVIEGNVTTWAGQTFSYEDGTAVGDVVEEKIHGSEITVAASEAALIFLPNCP